MAIASVYLGQDHNYDQRNYHLYDGYSYYHGRFDLDYLVADIHTFLNPSLHALQYLLISSFRPAITGAILGIVHSLNLIAAAVLVLYFLDGPRWAKYMMAVLASAAAASGPMFLSEIGTTFSDIWTAPAVVLAAGLIAMSPSSQNSKYLLAIAGVLLGVAAAVKLTNGSFALAGAVCVIFLKIRTDISWTAFVCFVVGGLIGFGLVGGEWAFRLWTNFSNPVFPFFNGLFRSPDFYFHNIKDERFGASGIVDLLAAPWQAAVGTLETAEIKFRDARMLLLVALAVCVAFHHQRHARPSNYLAVFGVFYVSSYLLWYVFFGIQRYMLPLEILAGPICVLLINRLCQPRQAVMLAAALTIGLASWTRTGTWGRVEWAAAWQSPQLSDGIDGTRLFVFLDPPPIPVASAVLALPASASYIRLGGHVPLVRGTTFHRRATTIVDRLRNAKAKALIVDRPIPAIALSQLQQMGLALTQACTRIVIQHLSLQACDLKWNAD
ncbi:Protein of unknown function [Roseomonas rosea]|uniref:Dolichyl-phosphate-mannose-protein mannosyltransferase n=2 Tax=Muricoccus roseus TaxID=198092 RepID=A0A1M6QC91_9PROT|nr:Protein of unknown function [Roseomonas rosea]